MWISRTRSNVRSLFKPRKPTAEEVPVGLQSLSKPHKDFREVIFRLYDQGVDLVILAAIPLMMVALVFALTEAVISTKDMIPLFHPMVDSKGAIVGEVALRMLVDRVLGVIILIELFKTFMEYARTHHIRLSNLLDLTIVFALREILIKLYAQVFSALDLLALCAIVIVLVIAHRITNDFRDNEKRSDKEPGERNNNDA
jgi:uncharacterized membrane protein (DUF373 family)